MVDGRARSRAASRSSAASSAASADAPRPSAPPSDLVERDRRDAGGQRREGAGPFGQADEPEERDPGHDPERRVQPVRDRLGAVGRGGPPGRPARRAAGPAGAARSARPRPRPWAGGQHEQHREEPQAASRTTTTTNPSIDGLAHASAVRSATRNVGRIGRLEVGVQPEDRPEVVGDLGLVQRGRR